MILLVHTFYSYPENKYVGGEVLQPGDTKCDLFIRNDVGIDEFVDQMKTSETFTIISEEEITLNSGQTATRIEMDSMGPSTLFITEINDDVIILTCFGNFTLVDAVAVTIKACEQMIFEIF